MDIYRPRFNKAVVSPDSLEQAVTRHDAVLVLHQVAQEFELASRQTNGITIDGYRDGVEICGEVCALIARCRPLFHGSAAAQDGSDASSELTEAERLGDVIVGAELETGNAVAFAGFRRQHDDREMTGIGPRSEHAAYLEAAQDRQVEIEDDQIGRPRRHGFQRCVAASDNFGIGATASFERVFDETSDILFVFDNKHSVLLHVGSGHSSRPRFRFGVETVKSGLQVPGLAWYSPDELTCPGKESRAFLDSSNSFAGGHSCRVDASDASRHSGAVDFI